MSARTSHHVLEWYRHRADQRAALQKARFGGSNFEAVGSERSFGFDTIYSRCSTSQICSVGGIGLRSMQPHGSSPTRISTLCSVAVHHGQLTLWLIRLHIVTTYLGSQISAISGHQIHGGGTHTAPKVYQPGEIGGISGLKIAGSGMLHSLFARQVSSANHCCIFILAYLAIESLLCPTVTIGGQRIFLLELIRRMGHASFFMPAICTEVAGLIVSVELLHP